MEKKTDGKMKSVASIPENYISILQLQDRWMKEKERKHKETNLGAKQPQVNGQRRREEVKEPRVNLVGRFHHINPPKKEQNCIEKEEEAEVSPVVSKKEEEEDGEYSRKRKKKRSKKKNQGGSVKEVLNCGSKAYIPKEIKPVKEEIQREKTVQNRENVAASNSPALESQFQHLQIKKRVEEDRRDREVKGPAKLNSGQGHCRNQKHETRTMVWVKKGEK